MELDRVIKRPKVSLRRYLIGTHNNGSAAPGAGGAAALITFHYPRWGCEGVQIRPDESLQPGCGGGGGGGGEGEQVTAASRKEAYGRDQKL